MEHVFLLQQLIFHVSLPSLLNKLVTAMHPAHIKSQSPASASVITKKHKEIHTKKEITRQGDTNMHDSNTAQGLSISGLIYVTAGVRSQYADKINQMFAVIQSCGSFSLYVISSAVLFLCTERSFPSISSVKWLDKNEPS